MHPQDAERFPSSILVVDEQVELVRELSELLRREFAPAVVRGHSSAREAAAQLARERPGLLICDLHMQRVGGMDLLTLARHHWGSLPIVILVAGMGLGMDEYAQVGEDTIYLQKPFHLRTLCQCIAALAASAPRGQRVAEPALDIDPGGPAPEEHNLEPGSGHATPPSAALPAEDPSLSTETPLPPPSPRAQDGTSEQRSLDELWELLDEEIEIIEHQAGAGSPDHNHINHGGETEMALTTSNIKENLIKLEAIEGFIGAALADSDSGMCLGSLGGAGIINLEIAAAANTEVVRSKRKAIKSLSLRDEIEDLLITLGKQYHLIRPVRTRPNLFFYLVLDRSRANLAMARYTLADAERELPM